MDPILDSVNVDTLRIVIHLLFLFASLGLLTCLLLQRFELVDFLRHQLVSFLQIVLELEHSLVFILHRLLVGDEILVDIGLEL